VLNTAAGKPAKTVMIIHEESLFGTGTANLLSRELPGYGYDVKEVIKHANPTRDFNNIVLRMKAVNPDIVIPPTTTTNTRCWCAPCSSRRCAQGDLLGAGRRRLQLQVRQGIPGRGQRHHRLQPLVQPQGQAQRSTCASASRRRTCSTATRCS
jgi:hypothetical protein